MSARPLLIRARDAALADVRAVALAVLSPLTEKNPAKVFSHAAPVVFSMARCIVAAFAVAMIRQIWAAGIAGWPEAVVVCFLAVAMPLLAAFEQLKPEAVVAFAEAIVGKFGVGATRTIASVYDPREPSKHDDHRED